jgi:hypothetical protein
MASLRAARSRHPRLFRVCRSRSHWREGAAGQLVRSIAFDGPLLKVQRSVASQDDEWTVPAAAFIRLKNLTGCNRCSHGAYDG